MGSVTLYHNSSDDRCIDKSITAISNGSLTCKFKEDCSIMTPELRIKSNSAAFNANYCRINEFGRYYYITDIIVSQQYMIVKCKEDVLMSFKDDIKSMKGYYKRTSNIENGNTYVPDERISQQNNKFPAIWTAGSTESPFGDYGDKGWVLTTAYAPNAAT